MVATAIKLGIVNDNGGMFEPNEALKLTDAHVFLERASKIINGNGNLDVTVSDVVSRGEAAVAIKNMLWYKLK